MPSLFETAPKKLLLLPAVLATTVAVAHVTAPEPVREGFFTIGEEQPRPPVAPLPPPPCGPDGYRCAAAPA